MNVAIFLIFVLSGFAGLAYELVWTKHLTLIFGVSNQAIATALAAFMAGLALGSVLLGRAADRARHPLRLYAALELGIGLCALALPLALSLVNGTYIGLARALPAHSWAFTTLRFLLCFAVVLVPTTLMGGTLPAMSRQFIRRSEAIGRGAGLLYGANTLGGVLGAAATGFLLLRLLGAHHTTLFAVAINLAVALSALLLSFKVRPPVVEERPALTPVAGSSRSIPSWLPSFLLIAFGLAGAASLAYEVLWTRVLIYFMDLTIYSFTTILVTFLTGIAVGSFLFARLADRSRNLLFLFGLIEIAIALSAVYLVHTMGSLMHIATIAARLHLPNTPLTLAAVRFAVSAVFILLPSTLMGGAFPVVTRLYIRDFRGLGRNLGELYAANTVGCVIGSLAAGFLLLRIVGAQQAIAVVAVLSGILGLVLLLFAAPKRTIWLAAPSLVLLAVGLALAWRVPPPVVFSPRVEYKELDLLFYREGPEASLAVMRNLFGARDLTLNGTPTAFTDYGDILSHKLLAHPPALLADEPKTALIIGFGMGSTAWSLSHYPLERIDCVELVPAEEESARFFLPENGDILSDPRFNLIIADGRNYLLTTTRRYDIISFNAIHPAFSPYLYTRDFYELCRSRLTDRGIICAWIPTNSAYFPSLLRTFQDVFPFCSLWVANIGHLSLIGTIHPLQMDFSDLRSRMADPALQRNLAESHLEDPLLLLSRYLMDEHAIRRFTADQNARINTDDLPHVEFDASVNLEASATSNFRSLLAYATPISSSLANLTLPADQASLLRPALENQVRATRLTFLAALAAAETRMQNSLGLLDEALEICPEDLHARYMRAVILADHRWDQIPLQDRPSFDQRRREEIARVVEAQKPRASAHPGIPDRYLTFLRVTVARLFARSGQPYEAERVLREVLATHPDVPVAKQFLEEIRYLPDGEAPSPPAAIPTQPDPASP
ncbi:MAG: fused MFS/spermidine synthase [Armatimonadota bacterium]|nr:MAG: fused MFS/spermidine synthase [Armatimonadota bacterium]